MNGDAYDRLDVTEQELSLLASLAEAMVAEPSLAPELLKMSGLAEGTSVWKAARTMARIADLPPGPHEIEKFASKLRAEATEPKRVAGSLLMWAAENAGRRRLASVLS